jgi:hypothetical protein
MAGVMPTWFDTDAGVMPVPLIHSLSVSVNLAKIYLRKRREDSHIPLKNEKGNSEVSTTGLPARF